MPSDPIVRRVRALLGQGLAGLVPAAPASPSGKYLDATGGWSTPSGGGGGASTHSSLAGLRWVGSGHTDAAYSLPWFAASGAAATLGVGSAGQFFGSAGLTPVWSTPSHPSISSLGWAVAGHTSEAYVLPWFGVGGAASTFASGGAGTFLGMSGLTPSWSIPSGSPGGADVAVADGGTGASTAAGARTNLGLGTAAVANAATTRAASGILQLDALGMLGMDAALSAWRYVMAVAAFPGNITAGYGFTISVAGTATTPSTSAYSHRFATANSGWFVSARAASRTQGFAYVLTFKLPSSTTSRRFWIGLGSTTMSDSDTAAGEFVGVRYSTVAGDAGFMPASRDGASQTIGSAGSAPVADVPYMLTMTCATGGGSVAVRLIRLDTEASVLDVSISATLPATGTAIDWLIYNHGQGTSRAVEMAQAVRYIVAN